MRADRPDPMQHAPSDPIARRAFLQRMGAAIALYGATGCTRAPAEQIVPYVTQPPDVVPGRPRMYATAFVLDGYATGVLVESHEGRPTKIEGNPEHPASLGATSAFEQASVLSLYDPDRMRAPRLNGTTASFAQVFAAVRRAALARPGGEGVAIVLAPSSSPTLARVLRLVRERLPSARVFFHGSRARAAHEGARMVRGRVLERRHDLRRADVVVSLDDDFLARGPACARLAHDFASRRTPNSEGGMNRLYVFEPTFSATGTMADHRVRVRAHDIAAVAARLVREISKGRLAVPDVLADAAKGVVVDALARDLVAHRGRCAILVGASQPPVVHAMAHALDELLGNVGSTVTLAPSPLLEAGEPSHDARALAAHLRSGAVHTLLVLGTNVVYASPADLELEKLVRAVETSFYLGAFADETADACTMTMPEAHFLESWGDARAFDGTVSIVQPLVAPLHGARTSLDVLSALLSPSPQEPAPSSHALVRETMRVGHGGDAGFEAAWRRALRRGVTDDAPIAPVPPGELALDRHALAAALGAVRLPPPGALEIVFPTDERVHDGRFANNAWLLELPTVVTKLTWSNAATLSSATAARLGLSDGDEVDVTYEGRTARTVAHVVPGHADDSVAITLGWGRRGGETNARGRGVNAYALLGSGEAIGAGVTVRRTGAARALAVSQPNHDLHDREHHIARKTTLEALETRRTEREKRPVALPLYQLAPADTRQWGMAIDLSLCTGCSACVVACQAENNVPTVGPDGVAKGRIMHWLRVDAYVGGDRHAPDVTLQPMLCQHCEKAPCEYVCPVDATVHSSDGLNQMVYNRCVGTRFCSNNCPYKVRRFNWFDYHQGEPDVVALVRNPDVTVRQRGVMEKCTFCVQRIREHEIAVHRGDADVPPVRTACQATCPTGAIVFGDLADKGSTVARLHADERAYGALEELGTKPRVAYLARTKNPNPEIA